MRIMLARLPDDTMPDTLITLRQHAFVADLSGALWWPSEQMLVAADLHLEKGSFYAGRGQLLPPYDSMVTLERLVAVVEKRKPRTILLLGDSFHDVNGHARLEGRCRDLVARLATGRTLIWAAGNHDPALPPGLPGERVAEVALAGLSFRHEPRHGASDIAGHLHPVARVVTPKGKVRRRCFVSDGARLLLPAFGAFTGGLNLRDPAVAGLLVGAPTAFVLGQTRVFPVGAARLFGD